MVVACVTLMISIRKGIYAGHLQWDIMRKGLKEWDNIYGAVLLGMVDTIYVRDREKFTASTCPTRGLWFGNFMSGSTLQMEVI